MRPPIAKSLKPLPSTSYDKVRFPVTHKRPEHYRGPVTSKRPNVQDQMFSKWDNRISNLAQDFEFDVSLIQVTHSTYFKEYVKAIQCLKFSPISVLYCNYCWNDWPIIGVFAFDRVTMMRFLRGQCCPSCEPREDRRNINETLIKHGPSLHFVEQAQRLGLRTDRFPYVGSEGMGDIQFKDIWAGSAKSAAAAKDWWIRIRAAVEEINPEFVAPHPEPRPEGGE